MEVGFAWLTGRNDGVVISYLSCPANEAKCSNRVSTVTGRNWVYTLGGKEVVKASLKKENGVKKIVIKSDDLASVAPALMLSCLERATDKYVSASTTTPMIISAVALALVRTAAMNNNEPPY